MKYFSNLFFLLLAFSLGCYGIISGFYFISISSVGMLGAIGILKLYYWYYSPTKILQINRTSQQNILDKKYPEAQLRKWKPVLAAGALFLALFIVFTAFQMNLQNEIVDLGPDEPEIERMYVTVLPEYDPPQKPEEKIIVKPELLKPKTRIIVVVTEPTVPIVQTKTPEFIPELHVGPIVVAHAIPTPAIVIPEPVPKPKEKIGIVAQEMPRFPGCENEKWDIDKKEDCSYEQLLTFLERHIEYPKFAKELGIVGKAYVSFVINKDGSISDIEILNEPYGSHFGIEVVRIVSSMPNWIPGKNGDNPVAIRYNLPVNFLLN